MSDAMFDAVAGGDLPRVRALLSAEPALARVRDRSTLSIMQFARYVGQGAILEALIAAGPALDIFEASFLDRADDVSRLLHADPSLSGAYSADGFTALHFAAFFGARNAIRVLVDKGADVEAVTKNFLTNMPIHAAAAGGRIDACALLLEFGCDVNAAQHGANSPLHTAAGRDSHEMAELFLSHGADPSVKNDEGKTPGDLAMSFGNMELAALLHAAERARD